MEIQPVILGAAFQVINVEVKMVVEHTESGVPTCEEYSGRRDDSSAS
jgi:hypothetical protein